MENWRDVKGYEGLYQVSDFGRVRRTRRAKKVNPMRIPHAKVMLSSGRTYKEVAAYLEASEATVRDISTGATWNGNPGFRPVKPMINDNGFRFVALCRDSHYSKKYLHRLVWEAFKGSITRNFKVNFKNGERGDCRLDNLEISRWPQKLDQTGGNHD